MKPNGHVEATPLAGTIPVSVDIDDRALIAPQSRRRRRDTETLTARVGGHKVHLGIRTDATGKPVQIKIDVHKVGATFRGAMHIIAALTSRALQRGAPLSEVLEDLRASDFEPAGAVETDQSLVPITSAKSILDFVAQVLEAKR